MSIETKVKTFWQRPEGKAGKWVVMPILIGFFGWAAYKLFPILTTIAWNTVNLIIAGAVLFFLIAFITNGKVQATISYMFQALCRGFASIAVELNPIAILEGHIEDLNKKQGKVEVQITALKGQLSKLSSKIDERKERYQRDLERASTARKLGKPEVEVRLYAQNAESSMEYIKKLEVLHNKITVLYEVLKKMKYYSGIMIERTKNIVEIKKDERESITKGYSAMSAAMDIIRGDGDKKALFDQAMQYVVDDNAFKVGEMERMLEASTDFINSVDLDNAIFEERGMKMLEEFDRKGLDTIFGDSSNQKSLNTGSVYANLDKLAGSVQADKVEAVKNVDKKTSKYFTK
jgi:phage shock protein A